MTPVAFDYERHMTILRDSVERSLAAAANCAAQGRTERVLWNLSHVARDSLRAGMLTLRQREDVRTARELFAQGARIGPDILAQAAAGMPASAWSGLHALFCCILAGEHDTEQRLAQWMAPLARADARLDDPRSELFARAAACFALGQAGALSELRAKSAADRESDPFWRRLVVYLDLYEAVLQRDQQRFDALMTERNASLLARFKDKAFGDLQPEFGGPGQEPAVIDFPGTAVAIVARRHGLQYRAGDPYVPLQLVTLAAG